MVEVCHTLLHKCVELQVVHSPKVGTVDKKFVVGGIVGSPFLDAIRNDGRAAFTRQVFQKAALVMSRVIALLVVYRLGNLRRGEADFKVASGDPMD